jgi:hypothetical protein
MKTAPAASSAALTLWSKLPPDLTDAWPGSCGPGCLGRVFPDGPFGWICRWHDFAYLVGGTKADFKAVERDFKRMLVTRAWIEGSLWWVFVAYVYSAHTRTWGWVLRRWRRAPAPMTKDQIAQTKEFRDASRQLRHGA